MKTLINLLSLSFIFILSISSASANEKASPGSLPNHYKLGIFPYLPTARILKVYTPVAEDFERTLGGTVTLRTKPSYDKFIQALSNEEYDIAFVQPYDYLNAHDKYNYLPLVRRSIPLRTVIIVSKDSKLQNLQQLKGKTIATPAKHSAVSRITNKALEDQGFNLSTDITRSYKKNHFACMQSVIIGEAAACGTADRALKHFGDVKMKDKFRVLYKADEIPNSLFIIHKRIPAEIREKLIESIINWPETNPGKKILAGGKIIPMIRTIDSDYNVIRK